MANLCLSILVVSCFQIVFASFCPREYNKHQSCDECIRCGGSWCHLNVEQDGHCMQAPGDDWCPTNMEQLPSIHPIKEDKDSTISPSYSERTLFPVSGDKLTLTYKSEMELVESFTVLDTSQTQHLDLKTIFHECEDSKCSLIVQATTLPDFCLRNGTTDEYVYVVISLTGGIEAAVKYHVPCACECSKKPEVQSPKCNGNGDWTCGVCKCYSGSFGENCDKCPDKRGDVQCTNPQRSETTCSGNGYCGRCETCICFPDREGSQYFDPENYCADICMVTSMCDACLRNGTLGQCPPECPYRITVQIHNEIVAEERDELNRRIWARCNETVDQCYLEYVAMKQEEDDSIVVMMINSCNDIVGPDVWVATKVPLILGVLGLIAAVAAVGGVMLWKHMNTVPPLPLTDPKYENIDAEDCIGENPLYKPPTSSFKNPTYGKW